MPNTKFKIVYSLKVHLALQQMGFKYETEMKNPQHPHLNCWVYVETQEFLEAFNNLLGGARK